MVITCGTFYQKGYFYFSSLTFDFVLLPSAPVVITCGTFYQKGYFYFLFQEYIIINQESY